ncbi:DUF6894 family protein [Methylobacterium durans]|uniref:DUF6894 family protein n=1 Tax=Methylobacterium durans TaxID=2202825 RepID=UPI003AB0FD55
MTRFFFDLHSDSLSAWDDEGRECSDADEILRHALRMLDDLPEAPTHGSSPAVVSVHDVSGQVVLTATLKPNSEPNLRWTKEGPSEGVSTVPLPPKSSAL